MALFRKAVRTLLGHKAQYLGALALVLLSSMLFVMLTSVAANLDHIFQSFTTQNHLADAEFVTNQPIDAASLAQRHGAALEACGVADVELRPGQVLRVYQQTNTLNLPAVVEGSAPKTGEILLDKAFATANGFTLGKAVPLGGKALVVSGYMHLPNYIYITKSKDELMNDPAKFGLGMVGAEDFAALPGATPFYAIQYGDSAAKKAQETAIKQDLLSQGVKLVSWTNTEKNTRVSYVSMEIGVLGSMSRVAPFAILLLTCVLLAVVMGRLVKGESVIIGTLYAQGMRKSELTRHYLLMPLLIGGLGSVLGALLGRVNVGPVVSFMLTAFPMPALPLTFDGGSVLLGILLPVLFLSLSVWLTVRKILRTQPAVLMKGGDTNTKVNVLERSLKLNRLPFPMKFKIREQVRSLPRAAFLVLGIMVATMLLLYGLTMQSSVDYLLNQGVKELYHMEHEYVYRDARQGPPPEGTEPFNAAFATLQSDQETSFYVTGVRPDSTRILLKDLQGNKLLPEQNVFTLPLAKKLGLKVGDSVAVFDPDTAKQFSLPVEAIADTYAGEFVFLPLAQFNALLGLPADTYTGLWTDQAMTFPEGEIRSAKTMADVMQAMRMLLDQMGVMIYSLTIAAFFIGLIIVYLVTGMVVEENRGVISLFKVFGYRKRELGKLILNANTLLVVLGYLLGIPALLASVGALYQSITQSLQLILPVKLNPWFMVLGLAAVLCTYELAKWMCRKKVDRIPMSEALKNSAE